VVALAGVAAVVAAFGVRLGLPAHTALLALVLVVAAAVALGRARADAESRRIRAALPAVCEGLAAAVRAGLPLVDAIGAISGAQPPAVARPLCETAALFRVGRAFDDATTPLARDFGPSALLLRETLRAFHRHGGDVARALDRVASLARDEIALDEEVRALTAQGRASALVLALLAPCGLLFFLVANPAGAVAFVREPRGGSLLSLALALEGIGAFWLWRLVRR